MEKWSKTGWVGEKWLWSGGAGGRLSISTHGGELEVGMSGATRSQVAREKVQHVGEEGKEREERRKEF